MPSNFKGLMMVDGNLSFVNAGLTFLDSHHKSFPLDPQRDPKGINLTVPSIFSSFRQHVDTSKTSWWLNQPI